MRSNKERWLRGGAVLAWTAVLACAAYAWVNWSRKDWRDFTPVERIGYFTPTRIQWGPAPSPQYPAKEFVTADVSGPTGSFLLVWAHRRPGQTPQVARVCGETVQQELVRGSPMAAAIDACLERGIQSAGVDAGLRAGLEQLRVRLANPPAPPS